MKPLTKILLIYLLVRTLGFTTEFQGVWLADQRQLWFFAPTETPNFFRLSVITFTADSLPTRMQVAHEAVFHKGTWETTTGYEINFSDSTLEPESNRQVSGPLKGLTFDPKNNLRVSTPLKKTGDRFLFSLDLTRPNRTNLSAFHSDSSGTLMAYGFAKRAVIEVKGDQHSLTMFEGLFVTSENGLQPPQIALWESANFTETLRPVETKPLSAAENELLAASRRAIPALQRAIVAAPEISLLSISPDSRYEEKKAEHRYVVVTEMTGHWLVTGETKISDKTIIAELANSLRAGVEEDSAFWPPPCFSPRHAIRFKRGAEEVTVLICFECLQFYTHGFKERRDFQVSATPAETWNRIFKQAGLTLEQ